jgi:hypothetical protein
MPKKKTKRYYPQNHLNFYEKWPDDYQLEHPEGLILYYSPSLCNSAELLTLLKRDGNRLIYLQNKRFGAKKEINLVRQYKDFMKANPNAKICSKCMDIAYPGYKNADRNKALRVFMTSDGYGIKSLAKFFKLTIGK